MSDRRNQILKAARVLFNKKGIDGVRTRDIAGRAGISLGNLTYYFPAKNDIVLALTHELGDTINRALARESSDPASSTLALHHQQMKIIFKTHLKYRFLFGRWGEIVTSSPDLHKYAREFLTIRFTEWKRFNEKLVAEGLAEPSLIDDTVAHSYIINMLALYWHQELSIYFPGISDRDKIEKALSIYFQTYKPYLTQKGLDNLMPLLKAPKSYLP